MDKQPPLVPSVTASAATAEGRGLRTAIRRLYLRLGWVAFGVGLAALIFSAIVAGYGLFTHQGNDFYDKSPWGTIAFPGTFLLIPAALAVPLGLAAIGWWVIQRLAGVPWVAPSTRSAWTLGVRAYQDRPSKAVLEIAKWTTGLAGGLLLLWGGPFLPTGWAYLPTVAVLTILAGVLLLRWRSWHQSPVAFGRLAAGVAVGVLLAIAYGEATSPTHSVCISGVGGRDPECFEWAEQDGGDAAGAFVAFLAAGCVFYFAASMEQLAKS